MNRLTDAELTQMKNAHAATIHTHEYPTRCGMCRLFARLEAAERTITDDDYDGAIEAWRRASGHISVEEK